MTAIAHAQTAPVKQHKSMGNRVAPAEQRNVGHTTNDQNAAIGMLFDNFTVRNERKKLRDNHSIKSGSRLSSCNSLNSRSKGYVAAITKLD